MSIDTEKRTARQRMIVLIAAGSGILLGTIQLAFYLMGYEFDTGLYKSGSLPTLTAVAWILMGALVAGLSLLLPRKGSCEEVSIPSTPFVDFTALIVAASLASVVISLFWFRSQPTDALGGLLSSQSTSDSTARSMLLLSLVLAIPSAIHFFYQFAKHQSHPAGVAAVLLFTAFTALRVYFDMRYLLMSPRRILHLVALLSVMLFLVAELRMARGLGSRRTYFALASLTIVFSFADAFSNLVLSMMGWQMLGSALTVYFFLLCVSLYALSRLIALTDNTQHPSKSETVITLIYPDIANAPDAPNDSNTSDDSNTPEVPISDFSAPDSPAADLNTVPSAKEIPLTSGKETEQ